MRKYITILLLFALIFTGCTTPDIAQPTEPTSPTEPSAPTDPSVPTDPTEPPKPTEPPVPGGDLTEQQLFDALFDINSKVQLQLDMSGSELQKMQNDYEKYSKMGSKSPIYRMGDLHVTVITSENIQYDYTVPEVGVRMKGNTSRTDFYNSNDGIYNIIHLKLDFQETFDDEDYYGADAKVWDKDARDARKDRTFATLEKMDLRWNRCDDSTFLKEYFAFATYRENGVPSPHTNLCSFDWAGEHMGVFTINEPIDKIFIEKYLPEEAQGGDLYKCGWAGSNSASFTNTNSIGVEDEDKCAFYAFDLKTNKKTSQNEALINLIQKLGNGSVTKESFASLVDMDNFLPYSAVSYLVGNPDDMRNNYNNFYVYFRGDTGQAMIFPYDFDRCLGVTVHWNPTGNGVTKDNPFGTTTLADNHSQKNPLINYSIAAGGYYVREYGALVGSIAESKWFSYENFASLYRIAYNHYANDAKPGKAFNNSKNLNLTFDLDKTSSFSSNNNISFKEYLEAKKNTLNGYLKNIDQYANASSQQSTIWYIRADYTNWGNDAAHILKEENGILVYRLSANQQCKLKVYNDRTGAWYGTECIPEDCTVPFETDKHSNIVLQPGNYVLRFDPNTNVISLEAE